MRLKSLKLAGFKSFANPTTFSFGKNITAIVGPNGCGKSNVIDAIRWVLGETSAKQLRGGAMSDIIFAGTQDKAAKSLASVELTFEHTQDEQTGIRHELNTYHELAVRRQVNKSGKSDYFINGTRCRRRDVVDIFLGTGMGARSYAVIEQGMIGRIVDSSPMQLREFIEEGAGVSRYQARREETHKKLTKAKENLERLNDLSSELEKQQKTLTRQAENAKKYQAVKQQLDNVEQELAIHQLYVAKQAEQQEQAEHKQLNNSFSNEQDAVNKQTQKVDKLTERIAEQQWLKDDAMAKLHQEQMQLQQADYALKQHATKIEQLSEKFISLSTQSKDDKQNIDDLLVRQGKEREQLTEIEPKLSDFEERKQSIKQKLEPLNTEWQQIHNKRDELQTKQRSVEKQQALNEQACKRLTLEQQRLQHRKQQWQIAWDELATVEDASSLEQTITDYKSKHASILRQSEDVFANIDDEQIRFNHIKAAVVDVQKTVQTLEKKHATLLSEYNTLHALVFAKKDKNQPLNPSTNLEDHSKNVTVNLPRLSDAIELTRQGQANATVLDTWLAMWLDVLVGSNNDDVISLITVNNPNSDNNALLKTVTSDPVKEAMLPSNSKLVGTLLPVNQLIKSPKLAIWQNAYIYTVGDDADLPELQKIVDTLPLGCLILTTTGWMVGSFGIIHLSKLSKNSSDSHFLRQREQQRKRLDELEEELTEIENELDEKQVELKKHTSGHDELQIILQELTARGSNLKQQNHELQQTITQLTAKFERLSTDTERLQQEQNQIKQEEQTLEEELSIQEQQLAEANIKLPELNKKLVQVEEERRKINQKRQQVEAEEKEITNQYQTLNLQKQQLTISLQHIDGQRINLDKQIARAAKEQSGLNDRMALLEEQLPTFEQAVKQQQQSCHERQVSLDELQGQLTELQNQQTNEREMLANQQMLFAAKQQQLAELTTKLAVAKERVAEASSRVDALIYQQQQQNNHPNHINNSINNNNADEEIDNAIINNNSNINGSLSVVGANKKVSSASLLADFIAQGRVIKPEKQTELQQTFQSLQIKLSRMGAVNLTALHELEMVNERLAPLNEQTDDIVASIDKLTDAISTIDGKTQTLFTQMLDSVNTELAHLFAKVFGGGQASLKLIEDDSLDKKDKWRAGLELMAQPKGKKNSRLAVLSGGEKTLTALSLIFAIFKQHPAPFCVLDEVDAPLDDANVERFTGLIEEMASDLQFVFISHNKLSMQIADELKGITMPTAGVSSLVSVSLDEAEQYIEPA